MQSATRARKQYDVKACLIAVVSGLAVAIPAGLVVTRLAGSILLLTAVVTLVGTGVSQWTYARLAKPGSRAIEDETCPR
jgi:hypothetical protein